MIPSVLHKGDNSNLVQAFAYYVKRKASNAVYAGYLGSMMIIFRWEYLYENQEFMSRWQLIM